MSAVLRQAPVFAPMTQADLDEVVEVERLIYSHPWTRGNFADSLRARYDCRTLRLASALVGYFVLLSGAGEAHLLNLSVAAAFQRRGYGRLLLKEALAAGRAQGAQRLFLEVRPSNAPAQSLYLRFGFRQVGVRRGYYPAHRGREDALVFSLDLA